MTPVLVFGAELSGVSEHVVSAHSPPHDVCLALSLGGAIAERGPAIGGEGQLPDIL